VGIAGRAADGLGRLTYRVQEREAISRRIERGPVAAKEATGYRCRLCPALGLDPVPFLGRDGRPFAEARHVTFLSRLEPGSLAPSKIITVSPDHHRQLHYGDALLVEDTGAAFRFRIDGVLVIDSKVTIAAGHQWPRTARPLGSRMRLWGLTHGTHSPRCSSVRDAEGDWFEVASADHTEARRVLAA
jgi:hypothetical protein